MWTLYIQVYIFLHRTRSTAIRVISHNQHSTLDISDFLHQHGFRQEPDGPRGNRRIDGSPFACMVQLCHTSFPTNIAGYFDEFQQETGDGTRE